MTDTLKLLRVSKGYTQKALADKLQVSQMTVLQWEHGRHQPTPSTIPALAKALDITPKYLIFVLKTNKHDKEERK